MFIENLNVEIVTSCEGCLWRLYLYIKLVTDRTVV